MCLESPTKTGRLFAAGTSTCSLFQIVGTATLKARLPYIVCVRGTWSRGRVKEWSDIDEPRELAGDELMKVSWLSSQRIYYTE